MTHLILAASVLMGRCDRFKTDFPVYAACQRADGTLATERMFAGAERHVRYWVRYGGMPCGEWPTTQESYVVTMVANDLYGDKDLSMPEINAIRIMMYDGPNPPRCP